MIIKEKAWRVEGKIERYIINVGGEGNQHLISILEIQISMRQLRFSQKLKHLICSKKIMTAMGCSFGHRLRKILCVALRFVEIVICISLPLLLRMDLSCVTTWQ